MALAEPAAGSGLEKSATEDLALVSVALARHFAAGATMWCVAPQWPSQGPDMAVEFAYPVTTGSRALPAVGLRVADAAAAVRLVARPGDILLALSTADHASTIDLLARSGAWGMTSVWLGGGRRPTDSPADHVVWLEAVDLATAADSGDLMRTYRMLSELTHSGLEDPGVLEAGPECTDDVCVTCSDQGRVAEVTAVKGGGRVEVVVGGLREVIDASLVDPTEPGDLLLVHAGVAITSLERAAT
jgi:hydrogenase maturation factor